MKWLKQIFTRKNAVFLALFALEAVFLLARFAGDFSTGPACVLGPRDLVPYADACTSENEGMRVENFSGEFAATRWVDLKAGSYQVVVTYANSGAPATVDFVSEIIPRARYDAAWLPAGGGHTAFSLWLPDGCERIQLIFSADCGPGEVIYITGVQLIPTHAWAYTRFLTGLVFLLLADWALLIAARRLPFPIRSVRARYSAAALAGIVAFACLPLGLGYLTYAHDLSIHLARIEGIRAGLQAGQFPVRMDPLLLGDRGYPFSLMYGDLLLYPAAVLRMAGFSLQAVYKLYVAGVTLATALVTRAVLRRMLDSESLALLGAGLYTLSFYRLTAVYVRGAVGEYTAMLFLPLVLYGVWRIYRQTEQGSAWCWLPLAAGFSGIVLTHLLSAEMAALFLVLFCLLQWRRTFTKPVFTALCKAAGAAVAWCLWFLVPLVQYMAQGVCKVGGANDATILYDKAAYVSQIFMMCGPGGGYAESLGDGIGIEMPTAIGPALVVGGAFLLLALLDPALRRSAPGRVRTGCWALGFGALALWMSTDLFPWYDIAKWENAVSSLAAKLQFPWRFLSLASALLVLAACCGLAVFRRHRPLLCHRMAAAVLALTVIPAGWLLYDVCRQSEYNRYNSRYHDTAIAHEAVGRDPVVYYQSIASIHTMAEQIGGGEYLPAEMENTGLELFSPLVPEGVTLDSYVKDGLRVELRAANGTDGEAAVTLPLLAYPGYTLTAAGEPGARLSTSGTGYLTVVLPAGWQGSVTVRWTGLWFWRAADLFSLLALAATAVCRRRSRR